MTGYQVQSEALVAHSKGSQEASDNFDSLARLLEQARVSDDCFGPIGELLAFKYFEGLQECQDLATQAKSFLEEVSEKTTDAAKTYEANETGTSGALDKLGSQFDGLAEAGGGPGSLSDLNRAGDGRRKSDFEQHAGYGSSWVSTAGDVARASSPPDISIATVNARMEQLQLITSPGQSFMDNGLGFLIGIVISPLVELVLEPAIGDPEQMRSTAQGWSKVAEWLDGAGEHEKKRADATKEPWQGEAGDAFRLQMTEFGEGAAAFANEIRGVQQILEIAADLFDTFVEIVIDMISELVMGLIIEWLAALAASWVTAGASVGAAGATTTAQVGITGGRLAMKVKQLLGKLKPLIDKLEEILQMVRKGPLREVIQKAGKTPIVKRNPAVKILSNFDKTGASTTANKFAKSVTGSDALAVNLAETGLRATGLSGTTNVGRAAWNAAKENLPGEAAEQGVKYGYNKAQDPSSEEDRRDTTDRGFTYE